jgi:hypothetical protein
MYIRNIVLKLPLRPFLSRKAVPMVPPGCVLTRRCQTRIVLRRQSPIAPDREAHCLIGGDGISLAIVGASIIAKVVCDKIMCDLGLEHTVYGWRLTLRMERLSIWPEAGAIMSVSIAGNYLD